MRDPAELPDLSDVLSNQFSVLLIRGLGQRIDRIRMHSPDRIRHIVRSETACKDYRNIHLLYDLPIDVPVIHLAGCSDTRNRL